MSLSSPQITNPAQHFFEWKGGEGKLTFYNKETKQNINVPLPFEFIVLDELHTITGYDKMAKSGFWSNEIRNIRTDDLTVRTKGGVKYVGPYKNDQGIAQVPKGANYTKSVYIAHKNRAGELIIGNFKVSGSALGAWIEFSKGGSTSSSKLVIDKGEKQTSPVGDFYPPVLSTKAWTDEEYNTAIELDRELQNYLAQYLTAPKYDDNAEPVTDEAFENVGKASPEQEAEFESLKAKKFETKPETDDQAAYNRTAVAEVFNDEPINLDDIPF